MPTCHVCRYLIVDNSVEVCPNCGAAVARESFSGDETEDIESQGDTSPTEPSYSNSLGADDKIELCDPGTFIGADDQYSESQATEKEVPTGDIEKPPSRPPDHSASPDQQKDQAESTDKLKKLSAERAAEIRSSLLNGSKDDSSATYDDASVFMVPSQTKTDKNDFDSHEEASTSQAEEATVRQVDTMTKPTPPADKVVGSLPLAEVQRPKATRRVAYFHKNFIQLTGNVLPVSGDELTIGDQTFTLKPKRIKREYAVAAFSILVALLLFMVGKQFISPTLPGTGTIIGIALDEYGRPLSTGSQVSLPEAGRKAITDAQGFFRLSDVGTGSYVISCTTPDGVTFSDNVSVVGDQITTVTIDLSQHSEVYEQRPARAQSHRNNTLPQPGPTASKSSSDNTQSANTTTTNPTPDEYSAIRLVTNVESPTLYADGSPLGKGNLTYKKLLPGRHSIKITRDGYKSWTGTVDLKPDQIHTLKASLEKIDAISQEPTYSANDFYESGLSMLADGRAADAIADFTEAVNLKPSMGDAYANRARAYQLTDDNESAIYDYIRAGEIYVQQNRNETAHQMFDNALDLNDDNMAALIDKGDLYLSQGNTEKAEVYFKHAAQEDKHHFRANYELGKLYFSMQKHKWADRYLNRAKDANPSNPAVYHYLMLNYFARDDFKEVQKTYADYKAIVSPSKLEEFKANPRFEPIIRVVGEYVRP